jgi:thymidylate synthase
MNKLDKDYQALLQDILDNGTRKGDRTGTGTISVFGRQIRHKMSDGFPLLTTKKMPFKTIVTELLWFLRGDTNIKYLVDNNCHIWDGDAYKNYCNQIPEYSKQFTMSKEEYIEKIKNDDVFARKWGELGPIYGKQWREWTHWDIQLLPLVVDQIQNLINDLKTNPDSRRLMVNAWNVGELDQTVLPPCHYGFQVYTRELTDDEQRARCHSLTPNAWDDLKEFAKLTGNSIEDAAKAANIPTRAISLMWNQRSVDTFLGLPFNIASYGLLLEIIAKEVNMVPEELIGNLGDVHLYSNHIEQAKEQIGREFTEEDENEAYPELKQIRDKKREAICDMKYEQAARCRDEEKTILRNIPERRTREPFPLPKLVFNPIFLANLEHNSFDEAINGQIDFELEGYQSHPAIKAPLSN